MTQALLFDETQVFEPIRFKVGDMIQFRRKDRGGGRELVQAKIDGVYPMGYTAYRPENWRTGCPFFVNKYEAMRPV